MSREAHDIGGFESVLTWREPVTSNRVLRSVGLSVTAHILFVAIFWALPETGGGIARPLVTVDKRNAIPLVAPNLKELTQRDPNQGKVRQELDVRSMLPSAPQPRAFRPPAPSGREAKRTEIRLDEAPQLQANLGVPQIATGPMAALPSPISEPQPILENIGPARPSTVPDDPVIKMPQVSIAEAGKSAGGPGGGLGSEGAPGQPTSLGEMQLLSDPQGVDFKPYLTQVLATVRRNWFAVLPPVAKTGRKGLVLVQFIIDRRGYVPKLVIATPSGTTSFDRAAVAAVSASYPFRPLPAEYQGAEIRLQLAFSYNLPSSR